MVRWDGERVATDDSVSLPSPPSGAALRDAYIEAVQAVTLGLAVLRNDAVKVGPIELIRFGRPRVTAHAVEWPIEGGLLARRPGGRWRLEATDGRVRASLDGWAPRLPRLLYVATHLQVHQLFTRLYLLRLRGRGYAAPGPPAPQSERFQAATIDLAFCLTLAGWSGRRHLRRTLLVAAAYHVACWSLTGRTLGGLVMRQRVVAVDGSRVSAPQAMFRLALLPLSWIVRRPVHDELAATEVISE